MRVAFAHMWTTLQGYGRSTTKELLGLPGGRSAKALHQAGIFGPSVVTAIDGLTCPIEDTLSTYVELAYANDCLRGIFIPIGEYYEIGGKPWDLNVSTLLPVLKPLAELYALRSQTYSEFAVFTKKDATQFFAKYSADSGHFGLTNADTRFSGLKMAAYVAVLKRDKTYFTQFAESIFLALLDKSAKVAGTTAEIAKIRETHRSVIDQLDQQYQKYTSDPVTPNVTGTLPARPLPERPPAVPTPTDARIQASALEEAQAELDRLIGLDGVKDEVRRLMNLLTIMRERRKHGLKETTQSLHFVLTGNPGTGKTTVARILGKIFFGFGILKTSKVVECDRSTLVGGYVGQTAIKSDEVIKTALDGVLFIDEAYTLSTRNAAGETDSYGQEAINTLLKRMEDCRDRLVVLAAGYPEPMANFLRTNPGLESRFTRFIRFEDYTVPDMCRIFATFCQHAEYTLTPAGRATVCLLFTLAYARRDERFGNARYVRNVFERVIGLHSDRLSRHSEGLGKADLMTLDGRDVPFDSVSGYDSQTMDLGKGKWAAMCPQCGKDIKGGMKYLGLRVTCKCGARFIYPWWNLVPDSIPGLPQGTALSSRRSDLLGLVESES